MKIRHATPGRNLNNIRRSGLKTDRSKGLLKAVWLHTPARSYWAIVHCMKRHKNKDIIILECDVPRSWLVRSKTGIWYCKRDIPVERIGKLLTLED